VKSAVIRCQSSAQCVTLQSGNRVSTSLGNSLRWTVFARNTDTAVPAEGNGDLQTVTLICVLVARPRRCLTLSNPVPDKTEWRLISATLCGWRCCFVADQLWLMKRIREEEECSASSLTKKMVQLPEFLIHDVYIFSSSCSICRDQRLFSCFRI